MTSVDRAMRHPVRFLFWSLLAVGAWRFVSGQHVTGHRRTNATFIHAGTKAVGAGTQMVKVARWDYLPGYKRALIRLGVVLVLSLSLFDYMARREEFIRAAWVLGALVLALGGLLGYRKFQSWQHNRLHVQPLHVALKHMLGLPDTARADDYITVPKTFATNEDTPARVILPDTFNASPDTRKLVSGLVLDKLGVSSADMDVTFRTVGRPTVVATKAARPPGVVLLDDVIEYVDGLGRSVLFLGDDKRGHVAHDLETESPHVGFSCESGTGKSDLLCCLVAQVIRKSPDNRAVCIDPKMASLEALRGVPGVRIVNNPLGDDGVMEMWDAIAGVKEEVMDRAATLAQDPAADFSLLVLVIDEINLLSTLSNITWEHVKAKGSKAKAPLWGDLSIILAAGRRFRVHVILVGQDLRETALGGIGIRTMLGLRGIAGYDAQMWSRFMQTRPIPAKQSGQGRWCYRINGADVWIQNVWGGPDPLALSRYAQGRVSHVPPEAVSAGGSQETAASGTQIVGLEAAAAWLEMKPSAFRKARQRRPIAEETRRGNQPCWTEDALRSWREGSLQEATP
jgi:hypothetical protein